MRTILLLSLLAAAGCGKEGGGSSGGGSGSSGPDLSTHQGLADAMGAVMRDWADVLDGIKDKKSAEAARPRLQEVWKRLQEINASARKLPELPRDEKRRLEAKAEEAMKPVQTRIEKSMERLQGDAETWAVVSAMMAEISGPPPAPPSLPAK